MSAGATSTIRQSSTCGTSNGDNDMNIGFQFRTFTALLACFLFVGIGFVFFAPSKAHADCPATSHSGTDSSGQAACLDNTTNLPLLGVDPSANNSGSTIAPTAVNNDPQLAVCADWSVSSSFKCVAMSVFITILTGVVRAFANIMLIVGHLFSTTLDITVLKAGTLLNDSQFQQVIQSLWTWVRDLANIIMIGLFTFIAISIILELEAYGRKDYVARVLVVAVLINFSYLFTNIIVNASNFTATMIYNNAISSSLGGGVNADASSYALPVKYLGLLKLQTISTEVDPANTQATFGNLVNIYNSADGGFWAVFMQALMSTIFIMAFIAAFLYGTVLLIVRFAVLLFLLLTSSWAFATFMLPAWSKSSFGWNTWWDLLLRNALLAPLLMISFAMSIRMATVVASKEATSSMGLVLYNISSQGAATTIVSYFLIIGFLILGIYIAGSLSAWTAGRASEVTAFAIGNGMGVVGRNTAGRYAQSRINKLDERAVRENRDLTDGEKRQKEQLQRTARSSFNPVSSNMIQTALTKVGAAKKETVKAIGEQGKGGIQQIRKDRADAAIKREQEVGLSDKQRETARENIRKDALKEAGHEKHIDEKKPIKQQAKEIEKEKKDYEKKVRDEAKVNIQQAKARSTEASQKAAQIHGNKKTLEKEHDIEMKAIQKRISDAHGRTRDILEQEKKDKEMAHDLKMTNLTNDLRNAQKDAAEATMQEKATQAANSDYAVRKKLETDETYQGLVKRAKDFKEQADDPKDQQIPDQKTAAAISAYNSRHWDIVSPHIMPETNKEVRDQRLASDSVSSAIMGQGSKKK